MRVQSTGVLLAPLLALCACSTQASRTAAFCAGAHHALIEFAELQDQPTHARIKSAARAIQRLADGAPSGLESVMRVEASTYKQWAKTGDDAPLTRNSFTVANDQLLLWLHLNCTAH